MRTFTQILTGGWDEVVLPQVIRSLTIKARDETEELLLSHDASGTPNMRLIPGDSLSPQVLMREQKLYIHGTPGITIDGEYS